MTFSKRLVGGISAATLMLGLTQAAFAACIQGNATGNWQMYGIDGAGGWVRCKLAINALGNAANTTCVTTSASLPLTNGRVKLAIGPTCTFNGGFNIAGIAYTIRHATMSLDKITMEGVGSYPGGTFSFNLTKL